MYFSDSSSALLYEDGRGVHTEGHCWKNENRASNGFRVSKTISGRIRNEREDEILGFNENSR